MRVSSLPMSVTTHSDRCLHPNYFAERSYCFHIPPPQNPASGLVLCGGYDVVDGNRSCSNTASIYPLLAAGGPPVKINPGSLYDGAALIAPEDGNTRGIWRPPRCGHRWSVYRPRRNRLATDAYPWLVLPDGRKYREWKAIPKVQPSSRGDSGLPPGWGYRSAPEVARSAKLHWQVQWLWIPCWLLYFEVSPSFLLTYECNCSFGSRLSFLTT